MFEQLDKPEKRPQVSVAMSLGIFAAYMVGAFGSILLLIFLGDLPFGIQITTVVSYTYFAFWYIFFPTRGMERKYDFRSEAVQREISRLLIIHFAFLTLVLCGETFLFKIKPRLPAYWLTEYGSDHTPLYVIVSIVAVVLVFFSEVLISRRILSRSVKKDESQSPSEWGGLTG